MCGFISLTNKQIVHKEIRKANREKMKKDEDGF